MIWLVTVLSFNNKPATGSIPFLSPFIVPGARALSPLLSSVSFLRAPASSEPCISPLYI